MQYPVLRTFILHRGARFVEASSAYSSSSWLSGFGSIRSKSGPVDLSGVSINPIASAEKYKEHCIPLTRRTLIREIIQDRNLLTDQERLQFEKFTLALDAAILNRYYGVLEELKELFDPVNPDKSTQSSAAGNRRSRLDSEFWLLQRLSHVLSKAGFRELSRDEVEYALAEHKVDEGLNVIIDPTKYDVLKLWALGRQSPQPPSPSPFQRLRSLLKPLLPKSAPPPSFHPQSSFFKRVVVAARLKRDDTLTIKIFKDIPTNALELVIPDGRLGMSTSDTKLISASLLCGSLGIGLVATAHLITFHASLFAWSVALTALSTGVGLTAWTNHMRRRVAYMRRLHHTLYANNVANNRSLLALLADRAQDETFKQALLAFTFLLVNRTSHHTNDSNLPAGVSHGVTPDQLEQSIESWVSKLCGPAVTQVDFLSDDAIDLLVSLGLVHRSGQSDDATATEVSLHALGLPASMGLLPQAPSGLLPLVRQLHSSEEAETAGFELVGGGMPAHLVVPDVRSQEKGRLKAIGWN